MYGGSAGIQCSLGPCLQTPELSRGLCPTITAVLSRQPTRLTARIVLRAVAAHTCIQGIALPATSEDSQQKAQVRKMGALKVQYPRLSSPADNNRTVVQKMKQPEQQRMRRHRYSREYLFECLHENVALIVQKTAFLRSSDPNLCHRRCLGGLALTQTQTWMTCRCRIPAEPSR